MLVSCWNVRGLNWSNKQTEVTKFIHAKHVDVMGIVETKVKDINKSTIQSRMLPNWDFVNSNSNRIWITWNTRLLLTLLC